MEVTITYETLFELLRREKNKDELQKLDQEFFQNLLSYLKDKTTTSEQKSIFDDSAMNEKQLQNIKKIIKELYDRREKKVIQIALNKSRTNSKLIDTNNMLEEEKKMYEQFVEIMCVFRKGILQNIFEGKIPEVQLEKVQEKQQETEDSQTDTKMIRFKGAVPKFVGKDLEIYGPFETEDVANLPIEIADILVNKERAELM